MEFGYMGPLGRFELVLISIYCNNDTCHCIPVHRLDLCLPFDSDENYTMNPDLLTTVQKIL